MNEQLNFYIKKNIKSIFFQNTILI